MPTHSNELVDRIRLGAILMLTASLTLVASACGDDSTEPEDTTLLGTWNVTSFMVQDMNPIAQGMSLTVTLSGTATTGSYAIEVENDLLEICEQGPNCTDSGPYAATATQITLDPNDDDPAVFSYTIQGSNMTWVGTIDSVPVTITLRKA